MPYKGQNITIKIDKTPYIYEFTSKDLFGDMVKTEDVCCDIIFFGDPDKRVFMMRMEEKIWKPLCDELLSDYLLKDKIESDPDLTFLKGTIISIWCTPDLTLDSAYFGHFGSRKNIAELPKTFEIKIRHDLEDAEKIGGKLMENAIEKEIKKNRLSWKCIERNMRRLMYGDGGQDEEMEEICQV